MEGITIDDFQCPQCEADVQTVYKDHNFHCVNCGNIYTLERSDNSDYAKCIEELIKYMDNRRVLVHKDIAVILKKHFS